MGNGAPNSNGAYQAIVPPGGYAGRSMTTVVNGQSVTVKIPPGVSAGQVFSFQLSDCTFNNSPTHGGEQYAPGHPLAHRNEAQSPAAQGNATYSVIVPNGIQPGHSFQVNVNGQNLMVMCPQNAYPGSSIVVKVPTTGPVNYSGPPPAAAPTNYQAPGTAGSTFSSYPGNSAPTTTSAISSHSPNGNNSAGGKQKFNVIIPPNVFPNQKFQANCNGVMVNVTCPLTGYPGQTITIEIPATTTPPPSATTGHQHQQQHSPVNHSAYPHTHTPPPAVGGNKRVQVLIPQGGYPGAQMDINVDGRKLRITIPPNAVPGQTITVEVPSSTTPAPVSPVSTAPTPYGYGNGESRSAVPYGLSDPNALPVQSQQETYRVTVPMDVRPGQVFEATVGGQKMRITCPPNASSGMILTIQGPSAPAAPQHDTYQSNNYQNNQPPPLAVAEPYNANSDGYDLPVAALISDSTTATTVYSGDGSSVLYSADGTTAGSGNNYGSRSAYPAVMTAPASSTTNNTNNTSNNSTYTNHFSNSSAPPAFNPSAVNMVRDEY